MTISREWNTTPTQIITNKIVTLTVTMHDKLGNPISGALAKSLSVKVDNFVIGGFFPDQFTSINAGKKHLFFESKQA